jgi:hypothetical protein
VYLDDGAAEFVSLRKLGDDPSPPGRAVTTGLIRQVDVVGRDALVRMQKPELRADDEPGHACCTSPRRAETSRRTGENGDLGNARLTPRADPFTEP